MKINIFDWESAFFVSSSLQTFDFDFVCCSKQNQSQRSEESSISNLKMIVDLSSCSKQVVARSSAISVLMKLSCGARPVLLLIRERSEITRFTLSTKLTAESERFSRVLYMCLILAMPLLKRKAAVSISNVDASGQFSKSLFELDSVFKFLASLELFEFREPVHFNLRFSSPFMSSNSKIPAVFLFRLLNLLKFND